MNRNQFERLHGFKIDTIEATTTITLVMMTPGNIAILNRASYAAKLKNPFHMCANMYMVAFIRLVDGSDAVEIGLAEVS